MSACGIVRTSESICEGVRKARQGAAAAAVKLDLSAF